MNIASSVFESAAASQAKALGMDDARCVFVPHLIQDASDDQMQQKAEECVDLVVQALTDKGVSADSS